ncbi:hypothetical protein CCHR01_04297 [Colletotrichum chrysophilum]|uniref:Uncharacterized protein n=1 Tax=Colletotrichum chrysophilum TaxID=1836956 RepID=A0AAD9ELT9_9PEZI|nr:hypothetical protein CCHR01_04297 [Colletotrichum chrysophilum]
MFLSLFELLVYQTHHIPAIGHLKSPQPKLDVPSLFIDMKYLAVLLAFAASSNAAWCNAGWGKPAGASCPSGYCEEPGSQHGDFGSQKVCVNPSNGAGTAPVLSSCLGSGFVRCCP